MAKAQFYMTKNDGKLRFAGKVQEEMYRAYVRGLPDREVMKMELSKNRRLKTNPQLGYWYSVVLPLAVTGFIDAGYDTLGASTAFGLTIEHKTDKDGVDEWLKAKYAEATGEKFDGKRNMTDEQMSGLIDWAVCWMAEWLGVTCPPPTERDNHAR